MSFSALDQVLIDECIKDSIDIEKIKELIADGANVNAFNEDYQASLYDEIIDYYIDPTDKGVNLSNFYKITELFLENGLILNHHPNDLDDSSLISFRGLPPESISVDAYKLLLNSNQVTLDDLDNIISIIMFDLYWGYHPEEADKIEYNEESDCIITKYSEEDRKQYYLALLYWTYAYSSKRFPESCQKEIKDFDWFDTDRNKMEWIYGDRTITVVVSNSETGKMVAIGFDRYCVYIEDYRP